MAVNTQRKQVVGMAAPIVSVPPNYVMNIQPFSRTSTHGTLVVVAPLNYRTDIVPSMTSPTTTAALPVWMVWARWSFVVSVFLRITSGLAHLASPVWAGIIFWMCASVFNEAVFIAVHLIKRLGGSEYHAAVATSNFFAFVLRPQSFATGGRASPGLIGPIFVLLIVILIWKGFFFTAELARKCDIRILFSTACLIKFRVRAAIFPVTILATKFAVRI